MPKPRRKTGKKFDSTLGYPGEGPKGVLKRDRCSQCYSRLHSSLLCDAPKELKEIVAANPLTSELYRMHDVQPVSTPLRGQSEKKRWQPVVLGKERCAICHQRGHLAAACPPPRFLKETGPHPLPCLGVGRDRPKLRGVRKMGEAKAPNPQAPMRPQSFYSGSVTEVLNRVEPAHAFSGDDVRVAMAELKVDVEVEAKEKLRLELEDIRKRLYSKACSMLHGKKLGMEINLRVVRSSLYQIAATRDLHKHNVDVTDEVTCAFEKAMTKVRDIRLKSGEALVDAGQAAPKPGYLRGAWECRLPTDDPSIKPAEHLYFWQPLKIPEFVTPITRIEKFESTEPWSVLRPGVLTDYTCCYYFLMHIFLLVRVFFEELFKQTIICICMHFYNRVMGKLQSWHRLPTYLSTGHNPYDYSSNQSDDDLFYVYEYLANAFFCIFASVLFVTMFEAEKGKLSTTLRIVLHSLMASVNLYGVILHYLWNVFCLKFDRKTDQLNGFPEIHDTCLGNRKVKLVATQADYVVNRESCECKVKFGARSSFAVAGFTPMISRQCACNEKISMDGRVGKQLPVHENSQKQATVLGHWRATTKKGKHFFDWIARIHKPIAFQQWLVGFPPAKKELFTKIKEDKEVPQLPLKASSFIKRELALTRDSDKHERIEKDPRFIQGCPPVLSVAVGPWVRKLAKGMRDALSPRGEDGEFCADRVRLGQQIIYTCGLSNETIGECFGKAIGCITELCEGDEKVVFLEDDQSRFDLHLTEGAFTFLDSLYRRKLPRKVCRLLKRNNKSQGRSVLGTKYSVPYTMQSGWPDTSLGDTAVNVHMKYTIHGFGGKWVSIVCGDDSVTVTTDRELQKLGGVAGLVQAYSQFGMEIEAKVTTDPLCVEFCSARFMPARGSYLLFPKVGKILAKLGWDPVDRTDVKVLEWTRGIASTLKYMGRYDPILGSLSRALNQRLGSGVVLVERNEFTQWFDSSIEVDDIDLAIYYDRHYSLAFEDIQQLAVQMQDVQLGQQFTGALVEHLSDVDC